MLMNAAVRGEIGHRMIGTGRDRAMLVVGLACLGAAPALAQQTDQTPLPGGSVYSGFAGAPVAAPEPGWDLLVDTPVITAPADPARAAPNAAMDLNAMDAPSYNSFAATDRRAPPIDDYGFGPNAMPVVVELFTSQGCSSCPPADAMLARLASEPGVLPLSFHVDYWDYLGWADSFAQPAFTERQERYARVSGERSVYTPQLIVDGEDTAVAPGPAELMSLIDAHRVAPALVSVRRDRVDGGEAIELMPLSDLGGRTEVLLVRYVPERRVQVTAGENRGKQVAYTNVVLTMDRLAEWDGAAPLKMTVHPDSIPSDDMPQDTRHVILVQKEMGDAARPGPIVATIPLD